MNRLNWQLLLGVALVVFSVILYAAHYFIFQDTHHIFIYMIGDIAFVPIEVLLVTLILHRILSYREKQVLLKKLNMVIGAFYNETGTELLVMLTPFLVDAEQVTPALRFNTTWKDADFNRAQSALTYETCWMNSKIQNMNELKEFLESHKSFLLRLLENPNLLEHDSFTDLLWAVFHLADELVHRERLTDLNNKDLEHLSGDMKRAYIILVSEWLKYMNHIRIEYPYLYSIAVRTNPFDPSARVEIA